MTLGTAILSNLQTESFYIRYGALLHTKITNTHT